jgi:hypothetical protein
MIYGEIGCQTFITQMVSSAFHYLLLQVVGAPREFIPLTDSLEHTGAKTMLQKGGRLFLRRMPELLCILGV